MAILALIAALALSAAAMKLSAFMLGSIRLTWKHALLFTVAFTVAGVVLSLLSVLSVKFGPATLADYLHVLLFFWGGSEFVREVGRTENGEALSRGRAWAVIVVTAVLVAIAVLLLAIAAPGMSVHFRGR